MTREEREALEQTSTKKSVKTTVNYFKKKNISQSTRDYQLNKYLQYGRRHQSMTKCSSIRIIQEELCQQSIWFKSTSNSTMISSALFNNFEQSSKTNVEKLHKWIMNKFEHRKTVLSYTENY